MEEILKYLPNNVNILIEEANKQNPQTQIKQNTLEIRVRINRPVILRLKNIDILIQYQITQNELMHIVEKICENSIYAYKNQICQGYITIPGGHRVGITGNCVIENGKVINIKYISSLNFRIAREIKGSCNQILGNIIDQENGTIYNTLIVSPPGKGKTTILRDIIRVISNGIPELKIKGKTCGVEKEEK